MLSTAQILARWGEGSIWWFLEILLSHAFQLSHRLDPKVPLTSVKVELKHLLVIYFFFPWKLIGYILYSLLSMEQYSSKIRCLKKKTHNIKQTKPLERCLLVTAYKYLMSFIKTHEDCSPVQAEFQFSWRNELLERALYLATFT